VTVTPQARSVRRPHWSLARSWLLRPARPGFTDGSEDDADVVVLDIEDGLPDEAKADGRAAVSEFVHDGGRAWVRINSAGTAHWHADVAALSAAPGLDGVILAKVESAEDVAATAARLPAGTPVVALVESALGVESALEIARSCSRIAFGLGDFRRDTGMSDDPAVLAYPRSRLVIASRAAGLPGPIDGPTLKARTPDLARDTEIAKSCGMTGRLCLDDAHAATVNRLLSPSAQEIAEARATVARIDTPGGAYDGSVGPTRARAAAVLDLAAKLALI
jgi:citrate lyase subunit beta / citryl-CoA lyase